MVWNLKQENSNFSTISLFLLVDEKSALLPAFQALKGFFKLYLDLMVEKKEKKSTTGMFSKPLSSPTH